MIRFLLLFLLSSSSVLWSQSGSAAPANRWYCKGGSASRSQSSDTKIRMDKLKPAWTYELKEGLRAPPLVWDERIVVLESAPKGRAQLKVLSVDSGEVEIKSRVFSCQPQPKIAIWGRTIAIQIDPRRIKYWRQGYTRIFEGRLLAMKADIQDFVLVGNILHAIVGDDLYAFDSNSLRQKWMVKGMFRGEFAVVDKDVYAINYEYGDVTLQTYDALTGRKRLELDPLPAGDAPAQNATFGGSVQVSDDMISMRVAGRFQVRSWQEHNTLFIRRASSEQGIRLQPVAYGSTLAPVAFDGKKVIFHDTDRGRKQSLALLDCNTARYHRVMASEDWPELFKGGPIACRTFRHVIWAKDCAYRAGDRVLLRPGGVTERSPVPIRGGVLFVSNDGKEIRALRDSIYLKKKEERRLGPASGTVARGRSLLRNGKIVAGKLRYDSKFGQLARIRKNGKERIYDLAEVLIIEDGSGKVVMAPSLSSFAIGSARLDIMDKADSYCSLASKAIRAKDVAMARRFIDVASNLGAEEKTLSRVRKKLDVLEEKKALKNATMSAQIAAAEASKIAAIDERLWDRIKNLPDTIPRRFKVKRLRRLFRKYPGHRGGRDLVNTWLPKRLQVGDLKDPASWLDFVVAADQIEIEIVDAPSEDEKESTWEERQVGYHQHRWRKDIIGVRSKRLLVLTPLKNPAQVARCLALGETLCTALEKIFEQGEKKRTEALPLVIYLFPTQKSFVEYGAKRGMRGLDKLLGFYSPSERLTRLFFPDSEEQLETLRGTFIHELTHHWIWERCPLFSLRDSQRSTAPLRGAWIIEGFAEMMREFLYDPENRTFTSDNPRAHTLDVVGHADSSQLFPWKTLLDMTHGVLVNLPRKARPKLSVKLRWVVGGSALQDPTLVFYSQAGALCHFLWRAEGGRFRSELLNFVALFYQGKSASWSSEKALGMSPEELGKRVMRFAREKSSGTP